MNRNRAYPPLLPALAAAVFIMSALFLAWNALSGDTIRVAAVVPATGGAALSNQPTLEGYRIAVRELNEAGGLLGREVELLEYDAQSTPLGSDRAARQAVKDGVLAILGPAWSSHALPVAKVAQAHGIPMLNNIATHPDIPLVGDYVFRVCFNDLFQGEVMARFALEHLHATTAALAVDITSDFSLSLAKEFRDNFLKNGGTILLETYYKPKQLDPVATAKALEDSGAEVCFIPGHDESGAIVKTLSRRGSAIIPLGGDGWEGESFLEKGGKTARIGYYCSHWSPDLPDPRTRRFRADYEYMGNLTASMALSYDAVYLLADAIRRAGAPDREAVRDALAATMDFQGLTGSITMDENGEPAKQAVILKVENGLVSYFKIVPPTTPGQ